MKKVISYSVWGERGHYLKGALLNIELARELYPGWTVKFYCSAELSDDYIKQFEAEGVEIVMKDKYKDPWFGLYWRFSPMFDDPQIERFIVRDIDSRITPREVDAVQQWIESSKPFHIMRDNTAHNIEILGGMWGSKPGIIPNFQDNMKRWMLTVQGDVKNPKGRYHGTDQDFLRVFVWPHVKNNHIAHGIKYLGSELPFRVTNPDGYKVGIQVDNPDNYRKTK